MKNKFKKAACFFLSIVTTVFLSTSIYATDSTLHTHSKECIYHCELDTIAPVNSFVPPHEHTDHADSENCKYSCSLPENNYSSSHNEKTADEVQSFLNAFQTASSDEELNAIIAEHYGLSVSDVDIVEMRDLATSVKIDYIDDKFVEEFANASSEEELVKLITDYADVSIEEAQVLYAEIPNAELNGFWDQLFCDHTYLAASCQGAHGEVVNCEVWCTRTAVCMFNCGSVTEVMVREPAHDWSVGWCGQTCKTCGLLEIFHEDGGCWYCS